MSKFRTATGMNSIKNVTRVKNIAKTIANARRDFEVLYFEEPIDEYIQGFLTEYKINDWGGEGMEGMGGELVGIHDQGFERYKEPDMNDLNTKTFVDVSRDKLLIPDSLINNCLTNLNLITNSQSD